MLDQNDSSAHVAEAQTQYQAAPEVAATEDGQGSPLTASDSKSCPLSSEYSQILRRAARTIFDPESLGNVDELLRKYDCQIKSPSDAIAYADEALKTAGDPYTDLHPREEAEKLERMEKGILKGGLGINMKVEPGTETAHVGPVLISRVVKDGPAARGGLLPGDNLVAVDGTSLADKTIDQTLELLGGEDGEPIKLDVIRDGKPVSLDITRGPVDIPAVEDQRLEDNIAYIRIFTFGQGDTAEELKAALERHQDASAYVVDLRDNGGGNVDQALLSASLFLDSGHLMSTRERSPSDWDEPEYDVTKYDLTSTNIDVTKHDARMVGLQKLVPDLDRLPDMVDKPVVILTNGDTASASEILAGALRENGAARLVGERTTGKGIGQTISRDMPEGSWLRVTTFRYFTPSGQWLGDGHNNRIGLKPDIESPMDWRRIFGSSQDSQLAAALNSLRAEQQTRPEITAR